VYTHTFRSFFQQNIIDQNSENYPLIFSEWISVREIKLDLLFSSSSEPNVTSSSCNCIKTEMILSSCTPDQRTAKGHENLVSSTRSNLDTLRFGQKAQKGYAWIMQLKGARPTMLPARSESQSPRNRNNPGNFSVDRAARVNYVAPRARKITGEVLNDERGHRTLGKFRDVSSAGESFRGLLFRSRVPLSP